MIFNGTTYEITGPDDALGVVLIHGLGLTRAVWQWLLPDLHKFRVLTYDLIGHGETAPPEGQPTLKDLADQLANLLDHLAISLKALLGYLTALVSHLNDLLTERLEIMDGALTIPSRPGWGADLNEEVARAHPWNH